MLSGFRRAEGLNVLHFAEQVVMNILNFGNIAVSKCLEFCHFFLQRIPCRYSRRPGI